MVNWREYKDTNWNQTVEGLSSVSLFQSDGWANHKKNFGWSYARYVCEENGRIVSAIQLLTKKKGPIWILWAPGGPVGNLNNLRGLKRTLKQKFSSFYLRIKPQVDGRVDEAEFNLSKNVLSARWTMHLDLGVTEENLLNGLSHNWRHNLKRANKHPQKIACEEITAEILQEMLSATEQIKGLKAQYGISEISSLLKTLNVVTMVARDENGKALSIRSSVIQNKMAWDLFAATTAEGRNMYSSYAVTWKLFLEAQKRGAQTYDLMGVDPYGNQGVYNFKKGTGAKLVEFPGEFEWASVPVLNWVVNQYLRGKQL